MGSLTKWTIIITWGVLIVFVHVPLWCIEILITDNVIMEEIMCVDNYYIDMLLVSLDNRMLATKEKERERERERERGGGIW